MTSPAEVRKSGKAKANSWLEITIREGKKHQIKRMVEACGHRVIRLKRIRFGPLQLGDLPIGTFRYATDTEANALRGILQRSMTDENSRPPRRKPYLKNRTKPGDTAAVKNRRKPLRPKVSREKTKSRGVSPTPPLDIRKDTRPTTSKRFVATKPTHGNAPLDKRVDRRSSASKRPFNGKMATPNAPGIKGASSSTRSFNFRETSAKPQSSRGSVRGGGRSSARPGGSTRSSPTQGNAKRSSFSKRPVHPQGGTGKQQPFKGTEQRPAYSKNPSKAGLSSGKRQSTKGPGGRSTFSKSEAGPIRKASTKRRSQK